MKEASETELKQSEAMIHVSSTIYSDKNYKPILIERASLWFRNIVELEQFRLKRHAETGLKVEFTYRNFKK